METEEADETEGQSSGQRGQQAQVMIWHVPVRVLPLRNYSLTQELCHLYCSRIKWSVVGFRAHVFIPLHFIGLQSSGGCIMFSCHATVHSCLHWFALLFWQYLRYFGGFSLDFCQWCKDELVLSLTFWPQNLSPSGWCCALRSDRLLYVVVCIES